MRQSRVGFVRQQGFAVPGPDEYLYGALMFQPRMIGVLIVLGVLLQSPWYFLALSAMLWWIALVPSLNPFDAIYNLLVAHRPGRRPLGAAPAPRRFAAGMAATFALATAALLLAGAVTAAWVIEVAFVAAVMMVIVGRFCLGSYMYYMYHLARRALSINPRSWPAHARHGCGLPSP